MRKWINKNLWLLITSLCLYVFFYYITSRSPIVGDAYNYANMGLKTSPLTLARLAYFSWSGRFFSELWGFFMCSKEELWNLLNPLFFVIIYISINLIVNAEKKISIMLLTIVMMLTVENHIRTQTYTWIMGTTYVIPLMLGLVYLVIIKYYYFDSNKKIPSILNCILNLMLFYIGLTMENIAGAMIMLIILIIGYLYFTEKKWNKSLIINLLFSVLGFALLRVSPGANGRLAEYHPDWVSKTLFEQLCYNIKYFVNLTFTSNIVVLGIFIVLLLKLGIKKYKQKKDIFLILSLFIELIALVTLFIPNLSNNIYANGLTLVGWLYLIFWISFIIASIYLVLICVHNNQQYILAFVLVGGASSVCLMISPIYSSRSLLYFVYFIMLSNLFLFKELQWDRKSCANFSIVLCIVLSRVLYKYYDIYSEVSKMHSERISIINYYLDHPEEKEAWIPRIPDNYIHSANIEIDNVYHMDTFKEYYGLPEDLNIIFYNKNEE